MSALPAYARVILEGQSEEFDPSVERVEMERGRPLMRTINSQVLMKLKCTLLFHRPQDIENFDAWYFTTIKRIGQFTMRHPRTGQQITANFEGGSIGQLAPLPGGWGKGGARAVTIEYLR